MACEPAHEDGLPSTVQRLADTFLPTRHGTFRMTAYRDDSGEEHVALSMGIGDDDPADARPPLVRVHSECLTGDALGSRRCDCGEQLQHALHLVARDGRGAVLYVRGHEGRGIGLVEKLRAYALQDTGVDTVDANLRLGHPADARTYDQSAAILADLGVRRIRLLSSNPAKEVALAGLGVDVVARRPLVVPARPENEHYLRTKRDRMGHDPADVGEWELLLAGGQVSGGVLSERYGDLVRPDGPAVLAQLGQSLDGFIASRTGDAVFVTGEADREHLHRLRALVDAVVVGAATAAADDCRLTVRAVAGRHPVRVVLDPRGTLPVGSALLTDGTAPTLWVVGPHADASAPAPHVEVLRWHRDGPMEPAALLAMLRGRGLDRVLVEGGGRLVSAFVAAGVVDRLYLTTAPLLIGDGVPGLRVGGTDRLADALRPPVRRWVLGEDVVTEFDLTGSPAPSAPALSGPARHALRSVRQDEQVDVPDTDGQTG
ncbi:GTP cyclohydrolase II [Ornithinimicrobium pekingense]|uniref:GTP cyclohydrolase-2 n=1 Tax=Ornithinimicrobium pekingense TaxID=384677 RepID=A0ABQ2F5N9_9MICO|nr:GTP cyclohydrolase II [Ornithinimicrobium pekingense]GGK56212.1 GTP cyclohydrolase-2 [Ornithinimicrobium pekingense]